METLNKIFNKPLDFQTSNSSSIYFGMGCFWGAEKLFWKLNGIIVTAVGYAAGNTINPSYNEVCYGNTNHAEVVKIVYDPEILLLSNLLKIFWEGHDPTQGMRQGNDVGTQYRSIVITSTEEQKNETIASKLIYEKKLIKNGFSEITTEIENFKNFYYAEDYHQQYLQKNPNGYCGLVGCNVKFN